MFSVMRFDEIARPTHDERARQQFVSTLRKQVMTDMASRMRQVYEREVAPAAARRTGRRPANGREVRQAMLGNPYFRAWSALRYTAQEMTWWSVAPTIERHLPEMIDEARRLAGRGRGSLRLNPALELPREVTALDIHLMPGCFHTEHAEDDIAQGALYTAGTGVFSAGLKLRNRGGVGASIARWLRIVHPQFAPRALLDLGTTTGSNLFPYLDVFRDCVGYGVDIGAPLLRYAHARAEESGFTVHFSQQDAADMDFPDGHFDLVVSSFFLHEQSVKNTRRILREARRVLRPGGMMVHMELPPAASVDAYYNFYLDWDAYYNNEPHYAAYRALDLEEELVAAGFARRDCFQTRIPNWGTVSEQDFRAMCLGEQPVPAHGNGASWFIFGATRR